MLGLEPIRALFLFKLYWYLFYLPYASLEFDFSGSCLVTVSKVISLLRMRSVCRYTVSQPEMQAYFNERDFSFFSHPRHRFCLKRTDGQGSVSAQSHAVRAQICSQWKITPNQINSYGMVCLVLVQFKNSMQCYLSCGA